MRKFIPASLGVVLLVAGAVATTGTAAATAAVAPGYASSSPTTLAYGPPPKCIPRDQWRPLGLESQYWDYIRTQGDTLFYDYSLNGLVYGEVSCRR